MRRPPLARLSRSPIGLVLVLVLAPLPAQPEELPSELGPEALPPSPTAWAVDRTIPDDPWLAPALPGPIAADREPCDPWSRAVDCTEEAEGAVLSYPWPAESALAQASAQPPPSEPAPEPADLRLELRGDSVDLEVDIEWAEASVPVISPLDLLVIDLGVPEAPFD
jgi:hypothetical protein